MSEKKKITVNDYVRKFIEANEEIVENINSYEVDLFFPETFLAKKHYANKAKKQIKERCELIIKVQGNLKEGVKLFDFDTLSIGVGHADFESEYARKYLDLITSNEFFDLEKELLIQCGFCDWQDGINDRDYALGVDIKNKKIHLYKNKWELSRRFWKEGNRNPEIVLADDFKDYCGYESVFLDVPSGNLVIGGNDMIEALIPRDKDIYWDYDKGAIGMDFFYSIKGLKDFLKWFTDNKTYFYFPGACYSNVYKSKEKGMYIISEETAKTFRKLPNSDLNRKIRSDHSLFFLDYKEAERLNLLKNDDVFIVKDKPGKWQIRYYKSTFEGEFGGSFEIIPA